MFQPNSVRNPSQAEPLELQIEKIFRTKIKGLEYSSESGEEDGQRAHYNFKSLNKDKEQKKVSTEI